MLNTLSWGLQRMDVFGQNVFLRINKQPYYRTRVGGLISLSVLFVVMYFFLQNLQSFFSKEELKLVTISEYEDQVQQLELDQTDFMFAFKIDQSNFTVQPFFNLTLTQQIYERQPDGSQIKSSSQISLIPCTLARFQTIFSRYEIDFSEQFQTLGLSDFMCPQINSTLYLGGTYTSSDFQFVTLNIQQCNNNTQCASQETIDNYFSSAGSFKMSIYTINQIVNPYKEAYRMAFLDDQLYFTFSPNSMKREANVFIRKYDFLNDVSLMPFSDYQEDTLYFIDSSDVKDMTGAGTSSDTTFATINFRLNPFKTKFTRTYQKVDELLSNLGGIQQAFFFFVGLLVGLYDRLQFLIEMANKLYEFSVDSTLKTRQHQDNLELINQFMQHRDNIIHDSQQNEMEELEPDCKMSQDISQRYNLLNLFMNTGALQTKNTNPTQSRKETIKQHYILSEKLKFISGLDYFQKQINSIIERQKPLYLNFQILCNYFSCGYLFQKQPRVMLLNRAFEKIIDQIDIYHILLKLNELEKLKETVLTYKQLLLFNFTPKPQINLDTITQEPSRQLLEHLVKDPQQNQAKEVQLLRKFSRNQPNLIGDYLIYSKIFNAYDDILQQSDTVWTNRALINKLGPELQVVFKLSKLIDAQHKIYKKTRNPTRRGAVQQDEEDLCVKMFDNQSIQS